VIACGSLRHRTWDRDEMCFGLDPIIVAEKQPTASAGLQDTFTGKIVIVGPERG
jgi:hypothetical protein